MDVVQIMQVSDMGVRFGLMSTNLLYMGLGYKQASWLKIL